MIKFNIPGLYEHYELNTFILDLKAKHPEYFKDNIQIASVFGNFPYCTWDGGRNFSHYRQASQEDIRDILNNYALYEANPRLIFTNPELTETDLNDRFCNMVLDIVKDYKGEVVVNSDLMKNYLQQNFPSYKLISSTTKRIVNPEKALEEIHNSDYFQVCIDYDLNKNLEFLNSIPKEDRYKVEILTNAICPPKCPMRKKHYSETGKAHLSYLKHKYSVYTTCGLEIPLNHPDRLGKGNNLSNEDIQNYYKMGFSNFKLEGRTLPSGVVFGNYLYYLIKPEYQYLIIEMVLRENILLNSYNEPYQFTGTLKPNVTVSY